MTQARLIIFFLGFSVVCSHGFSHDFFVKTIEKKNYYAMECLNSETALLKLCNENLPVIMGEFNNGTSLKGVFYGNTDSDGNPKNL